jgi:hypothetical protein
MKEELMGIRFAIVMLAMTILMHGCFTHFAIEDLAHAISFLH